jgi:predicted negative regulator of RcsB-dependent stress response
MGTSAGSRNFHHESEQSFTDFLDRYRRHLAYALIAVFLLVGGVWYYFRANTLKETHAEQAFQSAMQSAAAGNIPLAQSDLRKLTLRYKGTTAGTEGAMALAKISYDAGKYQDGIDALKGADPPDDMKYDTHRLIAVGYLELGKSLEAAKEYETAAKVARFDADRDLANADAASAYQAAGKRESAIKIWTKLAQDPKSPAAAEARVRLGELEAQVVKA